MKLNFAIALVLFASCGGSQPVPTESGAETVSKKSQKPATIAASTSYFYGDVHTLAPDGKTPYGPPTKSLVRRIVRPASSTIIEEIWLDGKHIVTEMARVQGTTIFRASDKEESFRGELTFQGEEWKWNHWTYAIAMSDGSGSISGEGTQDENGITTEKQFKSPDGVLRAVIKENLARISEAEFEEHNAK